MNLNVTNYQTKNRRRPITPLVAKQILNCNQQDFTLFGIPVQIICLVGITKNINFEMRKVTCFLEDFTGTIPAEMCLETENEMTSKACLFIENKYAQVFGTIRSDNQQVSIMILKVIPIDDANVITCHLLQVICARLEAESELKKQISAANITGMALVSALSTTEDVSATVIPQLTSLQRSVLNIIESAVSHSGITKEYIFQQFHLNQAYNVNQALEHLISEGLIYPTRDQNCFKVVGNI